MRCDVEDETMRKTPRGSHDDGARREEAKHFHTVPRSSDMETRPASGQDRQPARVDGGGSIREYERREIGDPVRGRREWDSSIKRHSAGMLKRSRSRSRSLSRSPQTKRHRWKEARGERSFSRERRRDSDRWQQPQQDRSSGRREEGHGFHADNEDWKNSKEERRSRIYSESPRSRSRSRTRSRSYSRSRSPGHRDRWRGGGRNDRDGREWRDRNDRYRDDRYRDDRYKQRDWSKDRDRDRDGKDRDRERHRDKSYDRKWSRGRNEGERDRRGWSNEGDAHAERNGRRIDTGGGPGPGLSPPSEGRAPLLAHRDKYRHQQGTPRQSRSHPPPRFVRPHSPSFSPAPPSPDVSQHLKAMARAHGIEAELETRVPMDVQALMNKINATEQLFRGNETRIWEKQYEEQRALLDKYTPKALLMNPPLLNQQANGDAAEYLERVAFGPGPEDVCSVEIPKSIPISAAGGGSERGEGHVPTDPRMQYMDQYKELAAWLSMHKFSIPDFAVQGFGKTDAPELVSPSVSWSHSPEREGVKAAGEDASTRAPRPPSRQMETGGMKRRPSFKDFLQEGLQDGSRGPSSQDEPPSHNILFAPSAPAHDALGHSLRSASASSLSQMAFGSSNGIKSGPLEVEEGFFIVSLPDGTTERAPFSDLLSLVKDGKIPKSWPAYREEDRLWLPLVENITLEDLQSRLSRIYDRPLSSRDKSSPSVWDKMDITDAFSSTLEVDGLKELKEFKAWLSKTKVECLPPHGRLTDSLVRRSLQLVVGGQERKGFQEACKGEDDDEIRRSAAAAFAEGETKWRIREGIGGSLPYVGSSVQPPPHVLAAVRAKLIGDRELVRKVAMGVLQAALRKHMEGGNRPPPQRRL